MADDETTPQSNELSRLVESITQRDWLNITRALDATKEDVYADTAGLLLVAAAWVKSKRDHGGATWDSVLDLTDTQLMELLGIDVNAGDVEPDPTQPSEPQQSATGTATELSSASPPESSPPSTTP